MGRFKLEETFLSKYQEYKHPRDKEGKWTQKYGSTIRSGKILAKNILHDAFAGGLYGATVMGYRNKPGQLRKGIAAGAAIGALSGAVEGITKQRLFKNKSPEQIKRIVSSPVYKALNVGLTSGYHTGIQYKANKLLGEKMGLKGALIAAGIGAAEDLAGAAGEAKIYGPDAPDTVAAAKLFTPQALKTGMFSKKKYKYGGLGPEIKQRKAQNKK